METGIDDETPLGLERAFRDAIAAGDRRAALAHFRAYRALPGSDLGTALQMAVIAKRWDVGVRIYSRLVARAEQHGLSLTAAVMIHGAAAHLGVGDRSEASSIIASARTRFPDGDSLEAALAEFTQLITPAQSEAVPPLPAHAADAPEPTRPPRNTATPSPNPALAGPGDRLASPRHGERRSS